jgi:uncharacterized protein (TIGR02145 family)
MIKLVIAAISGISILIAVMPSFAGDCGDVNNTGTVNALDITYLINYLYKGGAAPNCGPEIGTVTDIDGNIYHTIKIGEQWWMVENLKVTHYRNGDPIPNVTNGVTWAGLTTGAYCEYNNDINNVATYGRLYNWYAVNDGRNIAPSGWHVPSDAEYQALVDYLGGNEVAGGKMKETGTTHWQSPNTGATNESGFTGLPGGYRSYNGSYHNIVIHGYFWSSTELSFSAAWYRNLGYDMSGISRYDGNKPYGFSVRCVRD